MDFINKIRDLLGLNRDQSELVNNQEYQAYVTRVFIWMTVGLLITAATSIFSYTSNLIFTNPEIFVIGCILEIVIIILFCITNKMLPAIVSKVLFIIYSVVNGISMSIIFYQFKIESIGLVFLVTAAIFACLAIYGHKSKKDFTKMGMWMLVLAIGCIALLIVNIILKVELMTIILECALLAIFIVVTIIDVQNMRKLFIINQGDTSEIAKAEISSAMSLYLDYVIVFLKILRFFGKEK